MSNIEKYKKVFIKSLEINNGSFHEELKYNDINEWDSIGHMTLIEGVEEAFNITMDTEDIIDFSDYKKGIIILKKYSINMD